MKLTGDTLCTLWLAGDIAKELHIIAERAHDAECIEPRDAAHLFTLATEALKHITAVRRDLRLRAGWVEPEAGAN